MSRPILLTLAGLAALFALLTAGFQLVGLPANPFRDQTLAGKQIYDANCASCHGTKLEGQRNWRQPLASGRLPAPPQDENGHTWHHADAVIFDVIKSGLAKYAGDTYESDMPVFGGILTDDQINEVIDYIKSTWPEKQRDYQRLITLQSLESGNGG